MSERTYWVYIMTNKSGTLYTGVTGNLPGRVHEHRYRLVPGFATRYKIDQLMVCGTVFRGSRCDCARTTDQGMAPFTQSGIDR